MIHFIEIKINAKMTVFSSGSLSFLYLNLKNIIKTQSFVAFHGARLKRSIVGCQLGLKPDQRFKITLRKHATQLPVRYK